MKVCLIFAVSFSGKTRTNIAKSDKTNNNQKEKSMRTFRTLPKVSRERAIQIAMNHNGVTRDVASAYTDSELKEVLRTLKLKPNF